MLRRHINNTLLQVVHLVHFYVIDLQIHYAPDFTSNLLRSGLFICQKFGNPFEGVSHSRKMNVMCALSTEDRAHMTLKKDKLAKNMT